MQTSNYSAKYGGNAGGVVNIVTRSARTISIGYQGTRIRNTGNGASSTFPTAASLNGDFSDYLSSTLKALNDPVTGQPFPNAQIPVSRFDPAAVALTKYLPVATGSGLVFYGASISQGFDETVVRVDHAISDRDRLTGRYFFDRYNNSPYLDPHNYVNNQSFAVIDSQT